MIIDTPCIGICSSVYGDPICRGCKRTAHEVIDWNRLTPLEKQVVYKRLAEQISSVLFNYIEIINLTRLEEKIIQLKIRLHPNATSAEKAFHLIRLGANKIKNLNSYGIQIKPNYCLTPLTTLFNEIDAEIFAKAQ